jgi:predicted DCC family thiol-disulfide oxidoreductase YuxK
VDDGRVIIAFDGECLMCNRATRFLAEHDRHDRLRFTRLQDPHGRDMVAAVEGAAPDSMLVRTAAGVLSRSAGVLAILDSLGGPWKALGVLARVVPRPLRDAAYDFIARHRYGWWGKADACAIPSEALSRRLL